MTLPLYRDAALAGTPPDNPHLGLWYDKFCDTWIKDGQQRWSLRTPSKQEGDPNKAANPKLAWIEKAACEVGDKSRIEAQIARVTALVRARHGDFQFFQTEARLVTGTGRSHPTEIGFTWHPTLAVPYLPGSSVKGLIHAWAVAEEGDTERVGRLFGAPNRAGCLCFLDALPTRPVHLQADVMTPHYGNWTNEDPPGDWRSPTPIPFLTTAADTPFLFAWMPRAGAQASDHALIADWLTQALAWAGAGAKTAVGYGRMVCTPNEKQAANKRWLDAKKEREQQQRLDAMDPFERELFEIVAGSKDAADVALYQELKADRWREEPEKEIQVLKKLRADWQRQNRWKPSQPQAPEPTPGQGKKKAKKAKKQKPPDKHTVRVNVVRARLREHGSGDE